jgi:hypothetical protein
MHMWRELWSPQREAISCRNPRARGESRLLLQLTHVLVRDSVSPFGVIYAVSLGSKDNTYRVGVLLMEGNEGNIRTLVS